MKRFYKFLMPLVAIVAMALPWNVSAQLTTIVADGTTTNSYIPIYGLWADDYTRSQFIYPATMLEDLTSGSQITSLTFYSSNASQNWGAATFDVKLGEVTETTLSSYLTYDATTVYSGAVTVSGNQMVITFDNPYTYMGGNLMVEFFQTVTGTYHSEYFYGVSATGASASGYSSSAAASASFNQRNFLAKMQIEYTPGGGDICYNVRNVVVSDLDSSSFTLTWRDTLNSGASYIIYDMSDTSVVATVYDTTYTITGLDGNTLYHYAIVTDCGTGSLSGYVRVNVRTACGTTAIPYNEGFEGLPTEVAPSCWNSMSGDVTVKNSSSNAHSGSQYLDFRGSYNNAIALPPMAQPTNELQVRFWTRPESFTNSSCGSFSVGYMTNLTVDSTFVELANWSYNSFSAYEEKEVPMIGAPDNAYIVLRQNAGATNWYWYVDDLVVEPIPACAHPLSVSASNITSDGATVTVLGSDNATFRLIWSDGTTTNSIDIMSATYTLTGLNSNTLYSLSALTVCDDGSLTSAVSTTFRTACGSYTSVPYIEGCEGLTTGAMPNCWQMVTSGTSGSGIFPSAYSYASNAHAGNVYFEFESTSGETEIAALPAMENINTLKLTFWASLMNHNFVLEVGVIEDTLFVPVDTLNNLVVGSNNNWHNSYNEYTVTFDNYFGSGDRMALRVTGTSSYTLMLDDFIVSVNNGCEKPTATFVDSVGPYTAHLRWTSGGSATTAYTLYYGTQNGIAYATAINGITDTVYTLTGLLPQTTYYAWVSTECGSDTSDIKPFTSSFTTELTCAPVTSVTMGDINYTAAVINWSFGTAGFPSSDVVITLTDNTDTNVAPVEVTASGTSYTFTGLEAGHEYTAILRNVCDAQGQFDTASSVTMSFMTTSCAEIASDGSTFSYLPTYTLFNYSYGQAIYTASQMPNIDSIHGVAFNVTSVGSSSNMRNWNVYMGLTSQSDFNSGAAWVPVDSMTLVASNVSVDASTTGWKVVNFDTTFFYDGNSNLVIAIDDNTGSWTSSPSWASIAAPNMGLSVYGDGTNYDPAAPVAGSQRSSIPAVRFVADCSVPTCMAPTGLAADSVTSSEITLHWTAVGEETSWAIVINDSLIENVNSNPYTITGLEQYTMYNIAVYAVCSAGDTSMVSSDINVQTLVSCPWPTNFVATTAGDTATFTWTNEDNVTWEIAYGSTGFNPDTATLVTLATNSYQETGFADGFYQAYLRTDCGTDNSIWVGPLDFNIGIDIMNMATSGIDTLQTCNALIYDDGGANGNYSSSCNATLILLPDNPGSDIVVSGSSTTEASWDYLTIYEGVGTSGTILFQDNNSGDYSTHTFGPFTAAAITVVFYSDVSVTYAGFEIQASCSAPASCLRPTDLTVSNITPTSADITWTPTGGESQWELTLDGVSTLVTTPSYSATGIASGTLHSVTVRAVCGAGDTSAAISPVTFFTPCTYITTFPWVEGFEDPTSFDCWAQEGYGEWQVGTGDDDSYTGAHSGSYNALIIHEDDGNVTKLISPVLALDPNTPAMLSFWHLQREWVGDQDELRVYYRTSQTDTWHQLMEFTTDIQTWTKDSILLPTPSATYQIAFEMTDGYGYGVAIDDITVTGAAGAGCAAPVLGNALVGETTATISWTGDANTYEVAAVAGNWAEPTSGTSVTGLTHTFTGLIPGTQYAIGVRAVCGEGNYSAWVVTNVTTADHPCNAPSNVTATGITINGATIGWTAGDADQTDFQIRYSTAADTTVVDVTTNPYTLTGLLPNTSYSVAVRAVCGQGYYSDWSAAYSFTTTTCQPVSGVTVSDLGQTTATVTWTAGSNSNGTYEVAYGITGTSVPNATHEIVTGTSYTITGLEGGTGYVVYVRSMCAEGVYSDYTSGTNFTTEEQTGIADVDNSRISLYPNPASSTVTLTGIEGTATVTVVDMNGREVYKANVNEGRLTINVSEMSQGAYFVRITGEQVNAIRKLIVR